MVHHAIALIDAKVAEKFRALLGSLCGFRRGQTAVQSARQRLMGNSPSTVSGRRASVLFCRWRLAIRCYLAFLLLLWAFLMVAGDRWWPATLLLFGPRWVAGLPLLIFVPVGLWRARAALPELLAAVVVLLVPVMRFNIPLPGGDDRGGSHLRVLTCNIHGGQAKPDELRALIETTGPDVVALQEFVPWHPVPVFEDGKWYVVTQGELIVASRYPVRLVQQHAGHFAQTHTAAIATIIDLPDGPLRFFSVHLTSPHSVFSDAIRLRQYGRARIQGNSRLRRAEAADLLEQAEASKEPVMMAGDFNLPIDSTAYRQNLSGFSDAFSVRGWGMGWTYFHQLTAVRIDHILSGRSWRSRRCWVGPDVGSDHRPLLADVELIQTP